MTNDPVLEAPRGQFVNTVENLGHINFRKEKYLRIFGDSIIVPSLNSLVVIFSAPDKD